jgi:SSS family solute:Na+ symporter
MAASILHPNLGAEFPMLRFPHEAAFLAIAVDVLPQGMLGLLICGIFAASLTDLGGLLNWGSGLLLRNFYLPVINPACPEKRLVWLSRLGALGLGGVLIVFGLLLSRYRSLGLFDLLNQFGTSLLMPLAIPAFLGLFYARTPAWSAWSTALLGLAMAWVAKFHVTPEMLSWVPGLGGPYLPEERTVFGIIATALLVCPVCIGWFFFTALFYRHSSPEHRAGVEEFFRRLRTPLPDNPEAAAANRQVPQAIGRMCLLYGGFIVLLALIPNPPAGRLSYVLCGGVLLVLGALIGRYYRAPVSVG